jgi:hypothetical protein
MTPTVVFLTRYGCVNTDTVRARLDEALVSLKQPITYPVIDVATLATTDPRGGYGTPTVLVNGQDLFGQPVPPIPHPEPT